MFAVFASSFRFRLLVARRLFASASAYGNGLLDRVPVERIGEWEQSFKEALTSNQSLLAEVDKGVMSPELDATLKKTVQEHVSAFVSA
ncbi:hypothetical protein JCM10207_003204 [Rhodosporidiobolus poonsookiae]